MIPMQDSVVVIKTTVKSDISNISKTMQLVLLKKTFFLMNPMIIGLNYKKDVMDALMVQNLKETDLWLINFIGLMDHLDMSIL